MYYRLNCFLFCAAVLVCTPVRAQVLTQQGSKLVGNGRASYRTNQGYFVPSSSSLYAGTFSATGPMITGRNDHTATLLANGKVLVVGGYGGYATNLAPVASAELYDPVTGTFSATGSMIAARAQHTATLLLNGKVLVAGGFASDGTPLNSAELYDPATGTFSNAGPGYVYQGTATLLLSGTVLLTGGGGNEAQLYDPATDTFSYTLGTIPVAGFGGPENSTATLLPNGEALIAAGGDASAWLYSPATGTFSSTGNMITGRWMAKATLLGNGTVLIAGGNVPFALGGTGTTLASAELYNPATGTFSAAGSMTTARQEDTTTLLPNGTVLVTGGAAAPGLVPLASAELYNPVTGTFSLTGSMTTTRIDHTATLLLSGAVLVTGGNLGDPSAELYSSSGLPGPPSTSGPLQFIPVTLCRVLDTRSADGPFGGPELAGGTSRTFDIPASACNIPSSAAAYSLNVTVVPDAQLGYLSVWPSGQSRPVVSTLNSDGRIKANAAIVPAGSGGGIDVYATDPTQLILDIDGYFVPAGSSTLAFYPVTPCRVSDTRNATGPLGGPYLGGGTSRAFPMLSSDCSIPSTAMAYSLNFTVVPHGPLGYITVWPEGEAQPLVSTLNALTGAITANAAIVPAGSAGQISVYASNDTDLVIDINGYFAPPGSGGLSLYTVTPCRVLDTRTSSGEFQGTLTANVIGSGCGALSSAAQAFVLNATVVPAGSLGYLTLWPDGEAQPTVSTLNALDGTITSNMAIVPTSNGSIDAFATDPTHLILDIAGFFAP